MKKPPYFVETNGASRDCHNLMSHYRITYQGYLEDEFDSKDEALESFIDELHDVHETDIDIQVEVWNGEEWEWV